MSDDKSRHDEIDFKITLEQAHDTFIASWINPQTGDRVQYSNYNNMQAVGGLLIKMGEYFKSGGTNKKNPKPQVFKVKK